MSDLLCLLFTLYWMGALFSYLFWIRRYMKKHGIKDMNKTTKEHTQYGYRLFLRTWGLWWYDLYSRLR